MTQANEIEILLVEDNPNDAELTLRALKKHHLANRLHHVKDGAEALDFMFRTGSYESRPAGPGPRLVLLDLKLPKVDGIEVLSRIKGDPYTQATPVVVLTSSGEERDLADCYRLGVNSYLMKPVDFEKFVQAVSQAGLYWLVLNRLPGAPA